MIYWNRDIFHLGFLITDRHVEIGIGWYRIVWLFRTVKEEYFKPPTKKDEGDESRSKTTSPK